MTSVFKVRHNKETHVYRTDVPADKKALLSLFRQVAEEWADKRRKEREGEHERRKSIWTHGGADVCVSDFRTFYFYTSSHPLASQFFIPGQNACHAGLDGGIVTKSTRGWVVEGEGRT